MVRRARLSFGLVLGTMCGLMTAMDAQAEEVTLLCKEAGLPDLYIDIDMRAGTVKTFDLAHRKLAPASPATITSDTITWQTKVYSIATVQHSLDRAKGLYTRTMNGTQGNPMHCKKVDRVF